MNVILNDYHEKDDDDEFEWSVENLIDGYVHHVYIEDKIEKEIAIIIKNI